MLVVFLIMHNMYNTVIIVGYEMTVYTTTEGEGNIILCAVVTSPSGGAPTEFTIQAKTRDGTASRA